MKYLSNCSIFLVLLLSTQAFAAQSIKDHEEVRLDSACVIDPLNENKMTCHEFCDVFNITSGSQLGATNMFWNCRSYNGSRLENWKSNWNTQNPSLQVTNCVADSSDSHKANCEVNTEQLFASSTRKRPVEIIEQYGRSCGGAAGGGTVCNFTGYYARIYTTGNDFYIEYDDYSYLYDEISAYRRTDGPYPWVSSDTGANVSGNYTITPFQVYTVNSNIFQHTFPGYCDGNNNCHHSFSKFIGFKACRQGSTTDCKTHTFELEIRLSLFD